MTDAPRKMRHKSASEVVGGYGRTSSISVLGSPRGRNRLASEDENNRFRANTDYVEKPRQILALSIMIGVASWLGFRQDNTDPDSNTRAALLGAAVVFLVHCFLQLRDTIFIRPHPGVWRLVHGGGMLYLFLLAAMLFQSRTDARRFLAVILPDLKDPSPAAMPPEISGAAAGTAAVSLPSPAPMECAITAGAIWRQLTEIWFVAHVAGWWMKMCIFRDWNICWVLSIGFEILELSLGWLVPQFKECWWDSLVIDLLGANLLGMLLGLHTLRFLENRQYDWHGHDPSRRGSRVQRLLWRFSPLSWKRWEWEVLSSFKRFAQVAALVLCVMVMELNAFLVLNALDIPKDALFNKLRLLVLGVVAMPGVSEYYQYIHTPDATRLGQNVWLLLAVMQVEILVWVKFLPSALREASSPDDVTLPWLLALSLFSLWLILFFTTSKPAPDAAGDAADADAAGAAAMARGADAYGYADADPDADGDADTVDPDADGDADTADTAEAEDSATAAAGGGGGGGGSVHGNAVACAGGANGRSNGSGGGGRNGKAGAGVATASNGVYASATPAGAAAAVAKAASARGGATDAGSHQGDSFREKAPANGSRFRRLKRALRSREFVRWLAFDVLFVLSFLPLLYLVKQYYY